MAKFICAFKRLALILSIPQKCWQIINFGIYFIQLIRMPRKQTLAAITPNKYYTLEATVKYIHEGDGVTTAIIEQDQVQRKIKFPSFNQNQLHEGGHYTFQKCFYSKNGWIKVTDGQTIKLAGTDATEFVNLADIYEKRGELDGAYISTLLEIIEVKAPQVKIKDGQSLSLTVVKGFSNNLMVDITFWNREVPQSWQGKTVSLEGIRVKSLTHNALLLVSSVYTKIQEIDQKSKDPYDLHKNYMNISQIYTQRTVGEINEDFQLNGKSYSIFTATVKDILLFDYEGCSKCKKKLQEMPCQNCGEVPRGKFKVSQMLVQDQTDEIILYVFDQQILGCLRLARKETIISGKIKSMFKQIGDQKIASHILTGISSIHY